MSTPSQIVLYSYFSQKKAIEIIKSPLARRTVPFYKYFLEDKEVWMIVYAVNVT